MTKEARPVTRVCNIPWVRLDFFPALQQVNRAGRTGDPVRIMMGLRKS